MTKNMQHTLWLLCILSVCILGTDSISKAFQPEFAEPLENLTVPVGRLATFRCLVHNLGGYRVGWVKADTKAIQAIHLHVITNNQRISVSHNGQNVWKLHISNVQEEDRGHYMCQINTDPMQSQIGYLDVVVPPDIVPEETSGDIMIPEGGTARLSCQATGVPPPMVMWRREDSADIVIRDATGIETKVNSYKGGILILNKISRSDMGGYLCIANNGVPPAISKRIMIKVHFHPEIHVPNQLLGAPLGTAVTLECFVEASPTPINYWVRDSNEMVISSSKYEVRNIAMSAFESHMVLTVHHFTSADVGGYRCVSKNSLGEVDSKIRLYEIETTDRNTELSTRKEEYKYSTPIETADNEIGSADSSDDEDDHELLKEEKHKTHKHKDQDNSTKYRIQNYSTTFSTNISNKVNKLTIEILGKINSTNNSYDFKGNVAIISCLSLVTIFSQYII